MELETNMEGRVGHLTEEQEKILEQFRDAIKDVMKPHHDDAYLLRWLRARKFNLKASEAMYRKSMHWREIMGVDHILEYEFPEVFVKYAPGGIGAHDKEGCPVYFVQHGYLDAHGMIRSGSKLDILKFIASRFETVAEDMKRQSEKLGKRVELCIAVHDFENFSFGQYMWKPALEILIEGTKMLEANYPEYLKKVYVINAPKFFDYLFACVKPFMSDDTVKKFLFFSSEREWKEALLQDIDADDLPKHWGGNKVDPDGDPRCPSLIAPGGKVPKSYYADQEKNSAKYANWKHDVIENKSALPVVINVEEAGTTIYYEFATDNHDIAFGVFRREGEDDDDEEHHRSWLGNLFSSTTEEKGVVILPTRTVNCHLVPETGTVFCEIPGTYVLKFDNTFSWYRRKKIMYNIKTEAPSVTQAVVTSKRRKFDTFPLKSEDQRT